MIIFSIGTTSIPSAPAAFSFGEMIEGILNPKANESKTKAPEKQIEETEEEKAKRLRKEARRKLRVDGR